MSFILKHFIEFVSNLFHFLYFPDFPARPRSWYIPQPSEHPGSRLRRNADNMTTVIGYHSSGGLSSKKCDNKKCDKKCDSKKMRQQKCEKSERAE